MENLEQQFSKDLLITQSSNSVREYSDPIPSDLLIDIFSRVPAVSIARFRCLSKFWASILSRPDFTELFLTKSVARPRILFVIEVSKELFVYSSPQPQNPVENSNSLVATRYHYYPKNLKSEFSPPLCGLVFLRGWGNTLRVICNPVTGESITLPEVKAATGIETSFFGYDPINKQFKVLYMNWSRYERFTTHRVLTLGTGKRFWRTMMECKPHYALIGEIWINGVLYYGAYFGDSYMIVCFDLRFEKFSFIEMDQEMLHRRLINYKGKLCAHRFRGWNKDELVLWVLEDAGEHKWSKSICVLPSLCGKREIGKHFYIVGTTGTGEIVFSPYDQSNPFYLFYYNIERNTFTRVNFQGFEEFEHQPGISVNFFLNYVENMTLDYASVFKAT